MVAGLETQACDNDKHTSANTANVDDRFTFRQASLHEERIGNDVPIETSALQQARKDQFACAWTEWQHRCGQAQLDGAAAILLWGVLEIKGEYDQR